MQGGGAAGAGRGLGRADRRGERLLEIPDPGAVGELTASEHRGHRRDVGLVDGVTAIGQRGVRRPLLGDLQGPGHEPSLAGTAFKSR